MWVSSEECMQLENAVTDPTQKDGVMRFEIPEGQAGPLRLSAEVCTEGVPGLPGADCMIFFNIEYAQGPIFWDAFLYPDTGSTPWRLLSCEVRDRGAVRAVELHIRFRVRGSLMLRNLKVETIPPWVDDAECVVAIFGDSTDMTNYLPTPLRLGTRLESLLRDRFADRRIDVHCLAEGGEFLQRLVESGRLERELRVLPRCDVALIRFGLNDESKGIDPENFRQQLYTACATIWQPFPDAKVVLATTIPPKATAYNTQTCAVATDLNLPLIRLDDYIRQRTIAGEHDWHDQPGSRIGRSRGANASVHEDGLSGDIHPNAWGAQMIAECYFEQLEAIVAERLAQQQQRGSECPPTSGTK